MADDAAVYEAIAGALAEVREPDLSPFDPCTVRAAMERVLRDPGDRQDFVNWLKPRVELLSGGRVRLESLAVDGEPGAGSVEPPRAGAEAVAELPLRVVVAGEPFSERVVLRSEGPVVQFPMRG